MRSLLLSRLSRLCLRKPPPLGTRHLFTETPLCRIAAAKRCGSTARDGDIGNLVICDYTPPDEGVIRLLEKTVPMYLMKKTIGASHGWVATLKKGVVCLQDDLNPSASDSNPKRISLPPLVTLPHCQTRLVTNIAMSSSSPEDKDCIVAVKFAGPQLSLCRPARRNPEWVNIRITDPGFFSSRVMYSKKDKMFSMPASGGTHIGSWDLEKHKLQILQFQYLPELIPQYLQLVSHLIKSDWGELDSCSTSEQLVESRLTGEMFMVKIFRERNVDEGGRMGVKEMRVFKLEEDGTAYYTEELGDLCIFLSNSEPFCLPRNYLSDDQPCNTIHFVDKSGSGLYFIDVKVKSRKFFTYPAPYFIPPQSYLDAYCS